MITQLLVCTGLDKKLCLVFNHNKAKVVVGKSYMSGYFRT